MKIATWFKKVFSFKKKVIFSFDVLAKHNIENPIMYVNGNGVLMFRDSVFNNRVSALSEWDFELKHKFKINQDTMVIDVVIKF